MSLDWKQQAIVITGAYGGLGKELCKVLSLLGAHLIITGRDANQLKDLKLSLSVDTTLVIGDVVENGFLSKLQETLADINTDGHILINNAAISDSKFLEDQSAENIRQMLDINLLAPMLLCKKLNSWLLLAKQAKIINIGSTFGAIGYPGFSSYCATKFGLRGFSQAHNRELSDTNISVQYLAPRAIATNINSDNMNELNQRLKNTVDTPEKLVPQIIKAIEKGQSEKFFGWPEKLFAKINGLFPNAVSGSIKKELPIIKQILKQKLQ